MYTGVDLYHGEGDIDFQLVKESGIDFVILKCGGSEKGTNNSVRWTDPKFYENCLKAKDAGLHVGAYFFAGAWSTNAQQGKLDAEYCAKLLKGVKLDFPVFYDFEYPKPDYWEGNTEAAEAFCQYMEEQGYYVGIYASDISGFKERLDMQSLTRFDFWVARYGKFPTYVPKELVCIWQYSASGDVNGIKAKVDMNECYIDYPTIIMNRGFNNY